MNIKGELDPGKLDLELFPLFSNTCRFFIVYKKQHRCSQKCTVFNHQNHMGRPSWF